MRILHLVPYFPPDRIGGVGEVAAHVHRSLLDLGYQSRVITSGTSASTDYVIRVGRSPASFIFMIGCAPIRTCDFDILHAHHGEALLLLTRARLQSSRPSILLTLHVNNQRIGQSYRTFRLAGRNYSSGWDGWSQRYVKSRVKHFMDCAAMRLADQISFISNSSAVDLLGEQAAVDAPVVYNGLPAPTESNSGNEVERVELLYVGTAGHRKRTDLLPSILDAVRARHPSARLRIVGFDLQSQPRLRRLFEERNLIESVVCEGVVASEQIEPFYRSAGVMVVPSAYEGLPMVIMEAFRAGLVCVAANVGGNSEIIEDGVNGYLVKVDRPNAMAKRCSELLSNTEVARRMGAAGRRLVTEKFNCERQVSDYLALYRSILGRVRRDYF